MSSYVIVGAGPTGSAAARLLADSGERVRLLSRRGDGPLHPRIDRVAADAADAVRLADLVGGATVLVNCAMPPYDRWPAEFPPLASALLTAAIKTGADYVMLGNVYGYGPVHGRITPDLPLAPSTVKGDVRARMWRDAHAAYEAGRVRVTEVRAADYLGAGASSPFTLMVGAAVLAGSPAAFPGDLDAPHSWSYTGDVARTLLAAARNDTSWGRAWHVPSVSELPVRALAGQLAAAAHVPGPRLRRMTAEELQDVGRNDPIMTEFAEMLYLYDRPTLLDASATETTLGVSATPLEQVLAESAAG